MEEAERLLEPESEWEPEFMQVQEQNRWEPERRCMPNWHQNLIEVMLYYKLYRHEAFGIKDFNIIMENKGENTYE